MSRRSTKFLKAALSALHYTGADGLLSPLTRGAGAIFMLHQVLPDPPREFEPNRILRVTPDFLDQTIRQVIEAGFDILSLDEMSARLTAGDVRRPFVCFTLDDGYRDNLEYAYPVFKRYGAPFTVYLPTDYADGKGELWWLALEEAIRRLPGISVRMRGELRTLPLGSARQKDEAFHILYWWLRSIDEADARAEVHAMSVRAGFDDQALCAALVMNWAEIRELAADPLCTIGAHTRRHLALAKLSEPDVRAEMFESMRRLARELDRPIHHFSYPFGDETAAGPREFTIAGELGLKTAVTTRKGLVHADCATRLHQLSRLSLNGDYQDPRYVKVLLSGLPFAFWNMANRIALGQVRA